MNDEIKKALLGKYLTKKFLEEYSSREKASVRKFQIEIIKNPSARYPSIKKWDNLKTPIIHSDPQLYAYDKEKIWTQIPLAGTLIISLMNVSEEFCLYNNGFSSEEIPQLIEMARTGKIKFALGTNPTNYEGLDYLETIIEEFEPPVLYGIDEALVIGEQESKKLDEEFRKLAEVNYARYIKNQVQTSGQSQYLWENLMTGRMGVFNKLKILGMEEPVKKISELMISNPESAEALITHYMLLTNPVLDPLTSYYNHGLSKLNHHGLISLSKQENVKLPEIGKKISQKLVRNADTFEGCMAMIEQYEENDLYTLMTSIDESVKKEKGNELINNQTELDEILDNVWKETERIKNQKNSIEFGIEATIGIIGTITTLPFGAFGGLLAGLGYKVIDQYLSIGSSSLSEKIIHKIRPNALVNIYDFRKKYKKKLID